MTAQATRGVPRISRVHSRSADTMSAGLVARPHKKDHQLTTFSQLGLNPALLKSLQAEGYMTPTPIQAQAIPHVLAGKDLLGIAQTGTGKTAAFALPILHRLAADRRPALRQGTRTLVLSPTRELATQIAQSFKTYGRHMSLTVALMYGGVPHRPQVTAVSRGVDILVATPGRLIQHIEERSVVLSGTEIIVLDEADQMLDMGFIRPIRQILSKISAKRQSLFFSATMPKEIGALAAEMLRNPERVAVTPAATMVDRVRQSVIHIEPQRKQSLLVELFADPAMRRTLVFTRTKRGADKVARHLEAAGIKVAAIHGNKSQVAREAALRAFRAGHIRGLIATDIAARGIDIDEVTHVVNFDLPHVPESYVHRIGRTARAGADGIAISLCGREERPLLRDIERLTRQSIASVDRSTGGEEPASNRHGLAERRSGPPAKFRHAHNGKRQGASTSKQQRRHRGAAIAR
jgi:ATP-dependent RNA helicase RhlE